MVGSDIGDINSPTHAGSRSTRVDPKLFGKPSDFSGDRREWRHFEWVFRNWFGFLYDTAEEWLDQTANSPVELAEAVPDRREKDKALYMSLAMVWKNEALDLVKTVSHKRGFESWRKLSKEYGATTGTSLHEYTNLLEYDFGTTDGFKKILLKCENQIVDFQKATSEVFSDRLKCATVLSRSPAPIRTYLRVHQHRPSAMRPGAEIVRLHNLTHCPYQSWCEVCVASKGRSDHYHREAPQPMDGDIARIQMDFMFVGAEGTFVAEPRARATVLTVICKDDGNLSATEVRSKTDEYGVEMVIRFLSTYESVEIKTDGEPSIVEFARRVQGRRDKTTTLAQTSVGGHQEIGAVERANGTVQTQLRAYFLDVQNRMQVRIIPGTQLFPWMLRHSVWTVVRYQSDQRTKQTLYERMKRLSIRISVGTIWRSGHGEDCRR